MDPALNNSAHDHKDVKASHWLFAVVPVVVTVAAIVALMWATGRANILDTDPKATPSLMEIFGNADPYGSLLWGSLAGLLAGAGDDAGRTALVRSGDHRRRRPRGGANAAGVCHSVARFQPIDYDRR